MDGTKIATVNNTSVENLSIQQLTNLLKQQMNHQSNPNISIILKLNDRNYSLWSRLIRIAIGGKGRLRHITVVPPPPASDDPNFITWEQNDLTFFSWIIQAIEPDLVANFVEYPTAKDLWDELAATYSSGSDALQIFDLMTKVSRQQQGELTLEKFYSLLQGYWCEIDRRQPNPMKFLEDINPFNRLKQETKLFQFLAGIHDRYDAVKWDLLWENPLPSVEAAYATVRRESSRLQTLNPTDAGNDNDIGSGLAARGRCRKHTGTNKNQTTLQSDSGGSEPKSSSWRTKEDRPTVVCSYYGKSRHTKEECFEIIGYP